ncbi:MAG: alpha/beta hydrolase [Asgard group archaeon]|nr:alpha/beta hydrolase [Asgard group archaeon]
MAHSNNNTEKTTEKSASVVSLSDKELEEVLTLPKEKQEIVEKMITEVKKPVPNFFETKDCSEHYVPVKNGKIRVFHIKPNNPINSLPIVLVAGWGTIPEIFREFYAALHKKVEFYYIETREKNSSKMDKRRVDMSVSQKARDVQDVLKFFNLYEQKFILFGTCWGATIVLKGLLNETFGEIPKIVAFDPMHKLWKFRFLSKYIAPILPAIALVLLKPLLKFIALRGMEEEHQRERTEKLIACLEPWKWKRAASAASDLDLFDEVSAIQEEIYVFNGTTDQIHDQKNYPKMAAQIPNARFFYLQTDESQRECLMGIIAREFAKWDDKEGVPDSLAKFEKQLK